MRLRFSINPLVISLSTSFSTHILRRRTTFCRLSSLQFSLMDESSLRSSLSQKLSAVESQGSVVRSHKDAKASKSEIDAAVQALNLLKLEKSTIEKRLQVAISGSGSATSLNKEAFRQAVNNTLERRYFCKPSDNIYGGVA